MHEYRKVDFQCGLWHQVAGTPVNPHLRQEYKTNIKLSIQHTHIIINKGERETQADRQTDRDRETETDRDRETRDRDRVR